VVVAPAWRGVLTCADDAQGLVIVSQDAGALTAPERGALLCRVLQGYALSTLSITVPASGARALRGHSGDSGDWRAGFDAALHWLAVHEARGGHAIGLFGEGEAALAALRVAVGHAGRVDALVACSGRVEQAGAMLARVHAATLLMVGGLDVALLAGHRQALPRLHGPSRLEAIPGATQHFSEPGAFDTVAHLASSWLRDHLGAARRH
jgi:putative phosphoribosyl transferase